MKAGAVVNSNREETGVFVSGAAQSVAACSQETVVFTPEVEPSWQVGVKWSQADAAITQGMTAVPSHRPMNAPSNSLVCVLARVLIVCNIGKV